MVMLPIQCIDSTVEQSKGAGGVVVRVGTRNPSTAVGSTLHAWGKVESVRLWALYGGLNPTCVGKRLPNKA